MMQTIRVSSAVLTGIAALLAILIWLGLSHFGVSDEAVSAIKSSSAIYFLIGFLCLSVELNMLAPIAIPRLVFLLGLTSSRPPLALDLDYSHASRPF